MSGGETPAARGSGARPSAWALAAGSVLVGLIVLAMKLLAWRLTGSVALYSDAIESIVNVLASIGALVAIQVSQRPADRSHPFGHTKAEYLSAVFEGMLVLLAAFGILSQAWRAFHEPQPMQTPLLGGLINAASTGLNALWAWVLISRGRAMRSAALIADGKHLRTDVVTSLGVVLGLVVVAWSGMAWLDALIAAAVGVHVLYSGWELVRESVDGLMDAAATRDIQLRIEAAIARESDGALGYRGLRTRVAGHKTFIEFKLIAPADMTVERSHAICDRLEAEIEREIDGATATIHVEPPGSGAA